MNANYLEVSVDSQAVPNRPLKPKFEEIHNVEHFGIFPLDL